MEIPDPRCSLVTIRSSLALDDALAVGVAVGGAVEVQPPSVVSNATATPSAAPDRAGSPPSIAMRQTVIQQDAVGGRFGNAALSGCGHLLCGFRDARANAA
jgi:hypothetical protein